MYPVQPSIVEMIVVAHQDDVKRALREARRGRSVPRRHVLRRARNAH